MPLLFERIAKLGNPAALKKYKGTFVGVDIGNLATINEGRQLQDDLGKNATFYRKNGLAMPPSRLVAANNDTQPNTYIEISEMEADGFSAEVPIFLQLVVEQGPKKEDPPDPSKDPVQTKNGLMMEVHDCCYQIATNGPGGYERLFATIDDAAAGTPGSGSPPPPPPPCPVEAKPEGAKAPPAKK